MKTPQLPPLAGMTPLGLTNALSRDQAALAQRKANSPLMAPKPQIPCDHGLFSDERDQLDLADMPMFHDAIEEE
jgi:hypothetical protein